ncbi:PREDICTED: T-lymphocyte activation antigen CD86 [Elephantulus edwardii]|uniref:T-lymphocyte activation antigen CD86 n=1 Tax=Elephantulus edwardii TaxID=28737 RepID=UPI0003F09ABF|nr:PREDICTED: T-lymphocyte activation antigen CD86 [Elephantulus edwardii]
MELKTFLVMAVLLFGVEASIKTLAYFGETANLPCNFINAENISLDELVVFWQDGKDRVVYELYQGKKKTDNVNSMYKDRHIRFDKENWTIRLHNVEIKDSGNYKCFVHRRSSKVLIPMHTMNIELSVVANFSQPAIKEDFNSSGKSDINLTCFSTQGYPQPKAMYFLLKTENSTTKYPATMEKYQDNITELYNVSISLYYTELHNTTKISIQCVLCVADAQPERTEMCYFSKPYVKDPEKSEPRSPPKDPIVWIAVTLLLVSAVFFLVLWKKKKRQPSLSHEDHECGESVLQGPHLLCGYFCYRPGGRQNRLKVELEETEKAKHRVKDNVLAIPVEEDMPDVNISKTPSSDDNSAASIN